MCLWCEELASGKSGRPETAIRSPVDTLPKPAPTDTHTSLPLRHLAPRVILTCQVKIACLVVPCSRSHWFPTVSGLHYYVITHSNVSKANEAANEKLVSSRAPPSCVQIVGGSTHLQGQPFSNHFFLFFLFLHRSGLMLGSPLEFTPTDQSHEVPASTVSSHSGASITRRDS